MKILLGVLLFVALIAVGLAPDKDVGKSTNAANSASDRTPEFQLAMLNAKGAVQSNDVTIIRFRFLLDSIQGASGEPHRMIGDKIAKGHDLLRSQYGREVTLLSFTEAANQAMRSAPKGMGLSEVIALLVLSIGRS